MILTSPIKKTITDSVLCWLATSSIDMVPNVSPKEIFCAYEDEFILIANIASPNSLRNIKANKNICVSMIDILVQKGYQLKGTAEIVTPNNDDFEKLKEPLYKMAGDRFPFNSITKIKVESAKEILAPSYLFYPDETNEEDQIINAKKAYKLH